MIEFKQLHGGIILLPIGKIESIEENINEKLPKVKAIIYCKDCSYLTENDVYDLKNQYEKIKNKQI